MNTSFKSIFLSLVLLLIGSSIYSQTTNLGDLYITAGTILSSVTLLDNKDNGNLINDGDLYLYDHYNNDGLVSFSSDSKSGVTHMVGSRGYQNISGNVPMEWYDAEFSNNAAQPAFHLSNQISIYGTSNFQYGIVDDNLYKGLIIFEKGSNAINASDASHVSGFVQKNGESDFKFPIGDHRRYRYAGVSSLGSSSDAFSSKYFFESSDLLYPHANKPEIISLIDNQEFWTIDKVNKDGAAFITLTWDENTTPAAIYSDPLDEMHIVRWDVSKKRWIDEGGVVNPATKEITTLTQSSDYGIFTLARVVDKVKSSCGKELVVYNAVSPNGDNRNDYFKIDGLVDCSGENTVEIYNRWGVKVYETDNYGSTENVFKGYSEGRTTINQKEFLPTGTYFYILSLKDNDSGKIKRKVGYLYLSR